MTLMILKFCGAFFVNFVFYDFFKNQLKPQIKDKKHIAIVLLLCTAVIWTVNTWHNGFANLIFGLSTLTVQMLLLFRDEGRKELFLLLTGEAVVLFLEIMTALFFGRSYLWLLLMEAAGCSQAEGDFIISILVYLAAWLVLRSLKFYFLRKKCAFEERFPLSFFVLPLSTVLIYLGIFFRKEGGKLALYSTVLGCILLPAANILMFYTIHKLFFVSQTNREQQLAKQQTALQQRYYQHLEEIDLDHRRYAHDLKNCMASIGALAAAGGNEEIVALLGDMKEELDTLTIRLYTDNTILNALLWEKEALAKRHGIQMDIVAKTTPEWRCIPGRDLIVMAGNLLDNAIEAAEQCPEKYVSVALYTREHFLVAEVENTCTGRRRLNGVFLSTKQDVTNHGFGLSSVRHTVEKYGGTLYVQQNGGRFTAILTIAKVCLPSRSCEAAGPPQNLPV
ncbi:MAG: GHKL domain-containing protein [Dorea sp.]|nr:GHKL domain-containing protein [Dorea sp.]